ncbi:synaptonemal complex central element protein 2 [Periophthalmus magnuspinnatus]|uniref:synaptonemal complex central element protein 2 n=1 Tax=Periophthalmus magnuspinnatus TaxID=409849 RepID=UPI00243657B3|nr:synaptonemal complex central element protein 2 [Periophthalmus magnuspinnatus]
MDYFFDAELPCTSSALPNPEAQTTQFSGHLSKGDSSSITDGPSSENNSVEKIRNKVEELVERINTSRASDKEMDSYQKKLSDKLSEMCQQLKDHLYSVYEDNSRKIEGKLTELSEILNNCQRLNQDLQEATQALSHLRDSF